MEFTPLTKEQLMDLMSVFDDASSSSSSWTSIMETSSELDNCIDEINELKKVINPFFNSKKEEEIVEKLEKILSLLSENDKETRKEILSFLKIDSKIEKNKKFKNLLN